MSTVGRFVRAIAPPLGMLAAGVWIAAKVARGSTWPHPTALIVGGFYGAVLGGIVGSWMNKRLGRAGL